MERVSRLPLRTEGDMSMRWPSMIVWKWPTPSRSGVPAYRASSRNPDVWTYIGMVGSVTT